MMPVSFGRLIRLSGGGMQEHEAVDASAASLIDRFVRILGACGLAPSQISAQIAVSVQQIAQLPASNAIPTLDGAHLKACQLVFAWRRDLRFLSPVGTPATLSLNGGIQSFDALVALVLPGHDAEKLLAYLLALRAVRIDGGCVELLVESLLTTTGCDGRVVVPGAVLAHLNNFLRSVEFNLLEKPSAEKGRFERACYVSVPADLVPIFERFMEERGQVFVDVVDEWLERHRAKIGVAGPRSVVGAGAYMFVHPSDVPIP